MRKLYLRLLFISICLLMSGVLISQTFKVGALDTSFNGTGASSSIQAMALQADGKVIIGGNFINYNGVTANRITRLFSNGSIDTTFNKLGSGADAFVRAIAIQTDGKIIVAGDFTIFNAVSKKYIARLNSDGSIDATFNVNFPFSGSSIINHINIQSDGKILVSTIFGFYRLSATGAIDNTFITSGSTTGSYTCGVFGQSTYYYTSSSYTNYPMLSITNSDGSVLYVGRRNNYSSSKWCSSYSSSTYDYYGLFQLNSVGTAIKEWLVGYSYSYSGSYSNYYTPYYISHLLKQTDGKILLAGNFNTFNNKSVNQNIMRLNADYSIDSTFNKFGVGLSGTINAVSVQPNGKILISGNINSYNNVLISNGFVRLKSDGTLDTTFNKLGTGPSNNNIVATSQLSNNKKVIIAGDFTSYNGVGRNNIARLFNCVDTYSSKDTTICSNKVPFVWNGTSYSTTGKYTASFTNSEGCDSIATLNLTVKNTSTSTITITACGSYFWNGTNYTTSGTKTFNTTNSVGCDSVATLNLTINNSSISNTTATIAITALPYTWNGINCTSNGTYSKTFVGGNSKGCDSTATLTLLISSEINTGSQWTWVSGDSTTNQLGIYGTKGTAAASNKPGARDDGVRWKDASGNVWLFGGYGYAASGAVGYLNDLWKYNTSTGQWTWVSGDSIKNQYGVYGTKGSAAASNKPGAKQSSISWTDASGNLWLFGGNGYDAGVSAGNLNDLWKYNTSTGQWTWVSGDNTANQLGVYGTKGIAAASNKPGVRWGSVSWTDASGNLWLYGGAGFATSLVTPGSLNDLWKYNTSSGQWTWVSGDNTTNQLGVYGTKGIAAASNKPGGRYASVSWSDASGNVWLFGGYGYAASGGDTYLHDLWKYNTSTGQWIWVSGDSYSNVSNYYGVYGTKGIAAASNNPSARRNSVSLTDASGNLWLFGGEGFDATIYGSSGYLNDLWKYNTSTGQWTWVSGDNTTNRLGVYGTKGIAAASNKPGARYQNVSWTDASGNIWLFGGYGRAASVTGTLNDLWKIAPICSGSTTTQTACDSYLWNGVTYTNSGTYTKTFTGTAGCDSLATLNLTIKNSTTSITNISICPSQLPYTWNGSRASAGTYTYTTTNSQGCDSVATLNLTVKTNTTSTTNISICPSQLPYSWNGLTFTGAGSQTKTGLLNSQSCDSSATLNLTVKTNTTSTNNVSICPSALPYSWNGSRTVAGTYTFTTTNSQGCDSLATLNLTISTPPNTGLSPSTQNICSGKNIGTVKFDSATTNIKSLNLRLGSQTFLATDPNGIFFDITNNSAQPILVTNLNIGFITRNTLSSNTDASFKIYKTTSASTASGNYNNSNAWSLINSTVYNFPSGTLSNNGYYIDANLDDNSFTLPAGASVGMYVVSNTTGFSVCYRDAGTTTASETDGVITMTSRVRSIGLFAQDNLTRSFYGIIKYQTGTTVSWTRDNTSNVTGTGTAGNTSDTSSAIAGTLTNNTSTVQTTTYTLTLRNVNNCTATTTASVTVYPQPTNSVTNLSICSAALPYSWNASTYTTAGTYTYTTTNSQGCDSVATLNLTVKANTTSTTNVSICPSELPYSWNGLIFNASGSQTAHLANSQGCDSAATLNLAVKTNTTSTTNVSICPSELPFSWNGLIFNASGSQTAHLINSQGCDSAAMLNLTVKTNTTSTTNTSICQSELPYSWNGSRTSAGTYTYTTTNSQGCDSVATLNLTVKTNTTSTTNVSICPSELPYSWNGSRTSAGTYTFTTTNSQGCDSVATLSLTVKANTTSTTNVSICPSELPYSWNGLVFNASGSQTALFTNSMGCDSTATIVVTIKEPTVSNNNISVCSNQLPYSWNGNSYSSAGIYIVHLTNAAGCDSAATLVLSVSTSSASSISISSTATTICAGTLVTFTATPVNGGTAPIYQWKKNGIDIGANSNTYSSTTLANGDNIWCILTSNSACATNAISNSNIVNMTVKALPAMTSITNGKSNVATALICSLGSITRYYNNTPYGTWSSNNPTVASVSSTGSGGNVKANTSGTATISYSLAASNGCVSSSSLLVTIAPQTAPTAISGNNSICVNATTALSSTAPVGTKGVWSSSNNRGTINASGVYTGKNAGTWGEVRYTVTNTTTGCEAYSSYAITVNPTPVVPTITYAPGTANPQLGAPTGGFCVGKVFSVVGTPNIPAGLWSSTGAVSITAGGSVTINTVGAGSIKYTYTSAAGCSNSRTVNGNGYTCAARGVSVSGEGLVVSGDFTLYPNPAKGSINLNVETLIGAGSIVITDLYGKTVKAQALSMGTNTIDIAKLSKGMYFVSTITNEGKITKKLVVE